MLASFISEAVERIKGVYGEASVRIASDAGRTLVRIAKVDLYEGCQPPSTPMLLVLDPTQPKPVVYVQPGQLLANGRTPKSTSAVMVAGESWMQFSFNIPWGEAHGIIRFIAGARQRFAQND
jgi:hypothetical protein